jgi:predicted small lipoprotein YifL
MRTRTAWGLIVATGGLLACAGCGYKGPLYLPERPTVVTHPAPAAPGAQGAPATKQKDKSAPSPPLP